MKLGVALAGGAFKGICHLGALEVLEKNGINVTIRREMGRDIDGACGQLRKRYITSKEG